jgi:hypothetical protein
MYIYIYMCIHIRDGGNLYTTPKPAKTDVNGKTIEDAKIGTIMSLAYDPSTGYVWAGCDNSCAGSMQIHQINPSTGKFVIIQKYAGPPSMATYNNEGFTIASACVNGQHNVFWSDDSANNGHSIRMDNIPCGPLSTDFHAPTMVPTSVPTNTRTPSFVPSAMPSPKAGSPTMIPTVKTTQMMSVTQVLTGIDVITADSTEFKTRYAKSVKTILGDDADSVVVTSVTATSVSSVTVLYTVTATNSFVTEMQTSLMTSSRIDALNKEINGYGYTVSAAVPTTFVNMSPTSMPTVASPVSNAAAFYAGSETFFYSVCLISSIALFLS